MDARLATTRDTAGQTIGARFAGEQRMCRLAPPAIRQASTLHFDGSVRARRFVQAFVFVVAAMAWEQAVPPPNLHGVGGNPQAVGHLAPCQQPAGPESLI